MTAEAVHAAPPEEPMLQCQQCPATTLDCPSTEQCPIGRAGWLIYEGTTIGGEPCKVVLCPDCAAKMRNGKRDPEQRGFDAVCSTCGDRATEDGEDDEPLTEQEADRWARMHHCEPSVQVRNLDEPE